MGACLGNEKEEREPLKQNFNRKFQKLKKNPKVLQIIKFRGNRIDQYAYGYFSFCLISCNKDILKNRTINFSVETSFCQFSNMGSSGLKKMFITFRMFITFSSDLRKLCLKSGKSLSLQRN